MTSHTNQSNPITRRDLIAGAAAGLALGAVHRFAAGGEPKAAPPDAGSPDAPPPGWAPASPRDEIRPQFDFEPRGGPGGRPCFVIRADAREGLDGAWVKTFPVAGGEHYRFSAHYRADGVPVPRRSVVAKLDWRDAPGPAVPL